MLKWKITLANDLGLLAVSDELQPNCPLWKVEIIASEEHKDVIEKITEMLIAVKGKKGSVIETPEGKWRSRKDCMTLER